MKRCLCKSAFTFLVSAVFIMPAYAGTDLPGDSARLPKDMLKYYADKSVASSFSVKMARENNADDAVESSLLNTETYAIKTKAGARAVFHFLKSTKLRNASRDKRISYRLYFGLAKTFVRLKLYPQAMQCYYQTLLLADEKIPVKDSIPPVAENDIASSFFAGDNESIPFAIPAAGDSLPADPTPGIDAVNFIPADEKDIEKYLHQNKTSLPVSNEAITGSYNDGKQATAYAIVLHVKQPVPGKRRSFTLVNNVGHFFITLIKFNAGEGSVSRSFGFYPAKENFFDATPLHPASNSVFKDDAMHDWDEAIGKFISRRRFEKIMRLIDHYNARAYHLNKNNCTDFGLYAAAIAGVSISNTSGTWPMGRGNNPASTGQSMLEGKFVNTDTGNMHHLFICNNADLK